MKVAQDGLLTRAERLTMFERHEKLNKDHEEQVARERWDWFSSTTEQQEIFKWKSTAIQKAKDVGILTEATEIDDLRRI